jgi:hypothetical protein
MRQGVKIGRPSVGLVWPLVERSKGNLHLIELMIMKERSVGLLGVHSAQILTLNATWCNHRKTSNLMIVVSFFLIDWSIRESMCCSFYLGLVWKNRTWITVDSLDLEDRPTSLSNEIWNRKSQIILSNRERNRAIASENKIFCIRYISTNTADLERGNAV